MAAAPSDLASAPSAAAQSQVASAPLPPFEEFAPPFDVCLYHGPCDDGLTAAWIYWRCLPADYRAALELEGGAYGPQKERTYTYSEDRNGSPTCLAGALRLQRRGFPVVFAATSPEEPAPLELVSGRRVLFLDRGIGRDEAHTAAMVAAAKSVRVVDHHPSNEAAVRKAAVDFPDKFSFRFNAEKTVSGASLAWHEFYGDAPVPTMVRAVQIADTWNWDQEPELKVKQIKEAMHQRRLMGRFQTLEALHTRWEAEGDALTTELADAGQAGMEVKDSMTMDISCRARRGWFVVRDATAPLGVRALSVLYVNSSVLASSVGNIIRTEVAPAWEEKGLRVDMTASWNYDPQQQEVYVSLRGPALERGVDLSVAAPNILGEGKRGGGGHKMAAGFAIAGIHNFHKVFRLEEPTDAELAEIAASLPAPATTAAAEVPKPAAE